MAKFLDLEGLNYFWAKIKSWVLERFAYKSDLNQKLDKLRSGQNIKTINGLDITGPGNIEIQGGSGGAVNSVNGKTGDVVLLANDVGALPNTTDIPTKVSDLTNDSSFSSVSIDRKVSSGTNIADITIDGTTTLLYAPTSGGGGGGSITIDDELSDTSTNPVQNKVIKEALDGKADSSDIPDVSNFITNTVNNLTNYYLKSETYTKAEVAALIGAIQQFHYEIYPTLPQSGQGNVLYLIGPTGTGTDKYEEYVYSNNDFTKIGDTSIDLSGYVTTSALNTALANYATTQDLEDAVDNTPYYSYVEDEGGVLGSDSVRPIRFILAEDGVMYAIGEHNSGGMEDEVLVTQNYVDNAIDNFDTNIHQELADVATSGDYNDLENTPLLATVATSGDYDDLINKPTIPTVPTNVSAFTNDAGYLTQHQSLTDYVQKSQTAGLLKNDGTVDTNTYLTQHQDISGKADKTLVASSMPSGGFLPNVVYNLGTLSGNTTFSMAAATDNTIANIWCWTFTTSSTAPTITWPAAITGWSGGSTPTINASKSYEITVMNGLATIIES